MQKSIYIYIYVYIYMCIYIYMVCCRVIPDYAYWSSFENLPAAAAASHCPFRAATCRAVAPCWLLWLIFADLCNKVQTSSCLSWPGMFHSAASVPFTNRRVHGLLKLKLPNIKPFDFQTGTSHLRLCHGTTRNFMV